MVLKHILCTLGNAKVAGMAADLKLVGLKYNIAAAVFFVRVTVLNDEHLLNLVY